MTLTERRNLPIWKRLLGLLFTLIAFAVQIALIVALVIFLFDYEQEVYKTIVGFIYFIAEVVAVIFVLYIVNKKMSMDYKLLWSVLILISPFVFCPIYLLNTTSRHFSNRKQRKIEKALGKYISLKQDVIEDDFIATNHLNVLQKQTYAPLYKNTEITFFNDILDKHNDMLIALKRAKKFILLEYFIFSKGYVYDSLYEVLKQKSDEGVIIYILYDDVGTKGFISNGLMKKLAALKNVEVAAYQPLGLNINLLVNYRDHRKICCIDGIVSYCGGDNIADEYIHKIERFGYWRDNAAKYVGIASLSFVKLFCEMWYISTKTDIKERFELDNYQTLLDEYNPKSNGYVVPFGDGPSIKGNPAYDLFRSLIANANRYIYISTPYFIIDQEMRNLIALKAKSGVKVIILMPKIADKKSVFWMAQNYMGELIDSNVIFYYYTPGFNHAKNIIVDDRYAFIGTINMDYRSLFLHYECGALLVSNSVVDEMKKDFENALLQSEIVTKESLKKRNFMKKLIGGILNLFAPFF